MPLPSQTDPSVNRQTLHSASTTELVQKVLPDPLPEPLPLLPDPLPEPLPLPEPEPGLLPMSSPQSCGHEKISLGEQIPSPHTAMGAVSTGASMPFIVLLGPQHTSIHAAANTAGKRSRALTFRIARDRMQLRAADQSQSDADSNLSPTLDAVDRARGPARDGQFEAGVFGAV
jgi:hypothetical protein